MQGHDRKVFVKHLGLTAIADLPKRKLPKHLSSRRMSNPYDALKNRLKEEE
jgi:hypothetical protein